jgi:hypothetical protein
MRCVVCTIALISLLGSSRVVTAQGWDDAGFWAADYALNILQTQATAEQVKQYAKTYEILKNGYFVVRTLVDDNHSLHKNFFDQLKRVSPIVSEYYKVGLIIQLYRNEFRDIQRDIRMIISSLDALDVYTPDELLTIKKVLLGMVNRAGKSLGEIMLVAIPGEGDLDMMDSERIAVIDRIYKESLSLVSDFRSFRSIIIGLARNRNPQGAFELAKLYEVID